VGTSPSTYPLGYFAVHQRAPLALSSLVSGDTLTLSTTTGDRTLAILEATTNLKSGSEGWAPLATNELPGYVWTLDLPVGPAPEHFFRVRTE
jgi:hypothetical protein